ncbi:PEP-CTERM sorting domain-containing protein [Crateriforma conspicua]|uniref:PEP-CTERM protein-sorting domain-containing protein n=1 Tax=Crateriforma conspicua TaxID=2527996 RepID=A0A5C5Y9E0_9PLAN|nr:PEP-CTERM sorting domain-containing protein [Crateriforma conspicua]QDV65544.1 hypothetical protein Mal65_47150 [Crateriforma conspicua]TWT70935.1 hypothetical protein Pan14r_32430 [Crateriforma conspicua]
MKKLFALTTFFALSVLSQHAHAIVTVSVDVDPTTPGIQREAFFAPGEEVFADFVLELSAGQAIAGYGFGIVIDADELEVRQAAAQAPGAPSAPIDGSNIIVNAGTNPQVGDNTTQIDGFDYLNLFGSFTSDSPVVVGSATFGFLGSGVDGNFDITADFINPTLDGFLDGNGFVIDSSQVIFNGASVTAVPEPTSLAALGLISSGVAYRMRRRRKTAAKK